MKTTFKKIVLVTLMFGTLVSYAGDLTNVGSKNVKVEFNFVKKGNTLTIKDESGVVLYSKTIQMSGTYSRIFNLSNLNDGIYTTELEKDFEIISKKIVISNGVATNFTEADNKIFKPVVRKHGDLVLVSKLNFNNAPLKVDLYYNDQLVSTETVEGKENLSRVYKLSVLKKGSYKVVINSNNRTFVEDFKI